MSESHPDPVALHVDDTGGEGRAVVLIHGWPLSGEAWHFQVPALQYVGYRVITYDRRGFGRSGKNGTRYDYDVLADDLASILEEHDLNDVTLVGFSMGGGEVARYIARHGEKRVRSVVFAGAVTPYMLKTEDNPEGPLSEEDAKAMEQSLRRDRDAFFDDFTTKFFSSENGIQVEESARQQAVDLCKQADQTAALACMESFGTTDFREDLTKISVPTLVLHGGEDLIVPIEGSGARTHDTIAGSELVTVPGAPHGFNVSHADDFNETLLAFLDKHGS